MYNHTKLEKALDEETKDITDIYHVDAIVARIIMLKGITTYQNILLENMEKL